MIPNQCFATQNYFKSPQDWLMAGHPRGQAQFPDRTFKPIYPPESAEQARARSSSRGRGGSSSASYRDTEKDTSASGGGGRGRGRGR